jgi:hypothetical protein
VEFLADQAHSWHAVIEALGAGPAAIALFDRDGRCMLAAVTGNAREFCRKRLASDGSMTEVTHRMECVPCGSMFEASIEYLCLLRRCVAMDAASGILQRARCWFLRFDRTSCTWETTQLIDGCGDGARVVGPLPDHASAEKLGHLLDASFDLCRKPTELRRAPHGQACVYFEMGRCPAPCDGSEPWSTFAARFEAALASAASLASLTSTLAREMVSASSQHNFERASEVRTSIDWLGSRSGQKLRHIGRLDQWARVVVSPAGHARAKIWLWRARGAEFLAETDRAADEATLEMLVRRIEQAAIGDPTKEGGLLRSEVEDFWMLSGRLFESRRAEQILDVDLATNIHSLRTALRKRAKIDLGDHTSVV